MCLEIALQRRTVRRPALMSRYAVSAARCRRQQARRKACRRTPFPSCHTVCKTVARRAFARSARTLLRASAWGEHARQREAAFACRQCRAHVAGHKGARKRLRAGRAVARQGVHACRRAQVASWLACQVCAGRACAERVRARRERAERVRAERVRACRASRLVPASFFSFSRWLTARCSPDWLSGMGRPPPRQPVRAAAPLVLEPRPRVGLS